MFEVLRYNSENTKLLCEMGGKNADMGMTIFVKRLFAGEVFTVKEKSNETAVLLLSGEVEFLCRDKKMHAARANPFEKKPFALHASRNTEISITAIIDSEFIVQQTDNEREFEPVFYSPENCLYQEFGKGQWGGCGHRIVSTMFDYDNAPYSNMVLGEVFTQPGKWSSYPPHHHPQPEVYYYCFDKPQGFGACYVGDSVYKSVDSSFCCIHSGECHQQAAAPGYEMYYVWLIRHIDGDPWYKTTRFVPDEHKWLTEL